MRRTINAIAICGVAAMCACKWALAQDVVVHNIMDRQTLLPNGDHPNAVGYVTTRDGRVVLMVGSPSAINVLCEWDGVTIHQLLASGDPLPGAPNHLWSIGPVAVSAGRVLVCLSPQVGPFSGLYELPVGGPLRLLLSTNDALPGSESETLLFDSFGSDVDGQFFFTAAYRTGELTAGYGLYRLQNDALFVCADGTTPVPNLPNQRFGALFKTASYGPNAALLANTWDNGPTPTRLYALWNGSLREVVLPQRPPGYEFEGIGDADVDHGVIRFVAGTRYGDIPVFWEWSGDDDLGVQPLVDVGCQIPGSATSNWGIQQLSSDGADIVFEGVGLLGPSGERDRSYALYLYRGGTVTRLLGHGDTVGGLPFATIGKLHSDSISNHRVAVKCTLSDPGGWNGESDVALVIDYSQLQPCPDVNCDGMVDLSDLALLLKNFGLSSHRSLRGDLDGDGSITLSDLAGMLARFGEACR